MICKSLFITLVNHTPTKTQTHTHTNTRPIYNYRKEGCTKLAKPLKWLSCQHLYSLLNLIEIYIHFLQTFSPMSSKTCPFFFKSFLLTSTCSTLHGFMSIICYNRRNEGRRTNDFIKIPKKKKILYKIIKLLINL